jgi:hypothetical protein
VEENAQGGKTRMAYTYHELKEKTLIQLREMAAGSQHEALQGYTQLNKEHLLVQICKAFNIDMHEHHKVVGIDKTVVKSKIRELKSKRDEAVQAHDSQHLKTVRREIHRLKRQLHKATV